MATQKTAKRATPGELSPLEKHALMLVGKAAAKVRDHLEPGAHAIDLVVRVEGQVSVGLPGEQQRNERPKVEQLVGLLLGELTQEQRAKVHRGVVRACAAWVQEGEEVRVDGERLAEAERLLAAVEHARTIGVRGNVTGTLTAEVVSAKGRASGRKAA